MSSQPMWEHQMAGVQLAEVNRDLGLFFEVGTGKTRCMVEALRRNYARAGKLRKTLILAPVSVCSNWRDEFSKYSKINPRDIIVLNKSGKQRVYEMLKECDETLTRSKIVVTNYESMLMDDFYKVLQTWGPEILVLDESQRVKNPESKRAKAVAKLADQTAHNYILTGTPILNTAADIFMQYRILDRGETFGKNFYGFRAKYFYDKNAGFKGKQNYFPAWDIRPDAYKELNALIYTKAIRAIKSECLDLPPLIRTQVYAEMSPPQIKAYKEMAKEYITFIESKKNEPRAVVAQLAVTKALRLQQIVTGFASDDQGSIHRFPCPRLTVLQDLLEEITPNNKAIVWAEFRENHAMIRELCEELKVPYRMLVGGMTEKERYAAMDEFRTDPTVKVMIASQGAGGVGINLIEASYSIYYSRGFKLEHDIQSEARNYRGGSNMHTKVTRINIVAKGTIDELVSEALEKKQNVADQLLIWRP